MQSGSSVAPFAAQALSRYAAALRFDALPADVVRRAKDCFVDAIGAAVYGHDTAAGQAALRYIADAAPGSCAIVGSMHRVAPEAAAFAGGVLTHAAELDSLRQPGVGVHPGAALVPAALAAAQMASLRARDGNATGRDLLTALVAGIEVMFRIGTATKHSAEARGFHAPGLTGPFGAAIVAGLLAGLDADALCRALGIAGSLAGGLLEFAKASDGGLVKRIHLGRAAQAGVTAVRLVQAGFDGPSSVLDGRYGFLHAYCASSDQAALTAALDGSHYETPTLCIKRYACHIVAHTPVYAISQLRAAHALDASRVASIRIEGAARLAANHNLKSPSDLVLAQYSVPYCVAAALLHDADDPRAFSAALLDDPRVHALAQRVEVIASDATGLATVTTVTLDDSTTSTQAQHDFPGCPSAPLSRAQLRDKFLRMTSRLGHAADSLFERLDALEHESDLHWLDAAPHQGGYR
ncbi:MmgE/PrpD family protein [Paraburkholderia phosphatilytica]|uniref:MmgE/PrpD family protein n=1 Tax=Paraburkholderia phosphatilytica TaxID=2282883 RepID=UPI000E486854|nr:MmgE/PrpD family protein [Paraburkholderia phosphatilytica]